MSQSSRQRLATDAEKLYAAHQLWLKATERMSYVNASYAQRLVGSRVTRSSNPYTILPEAVYPYMRGVGEGHHEDFMRAFFRLKVDDIGSLFPHLLAIVRSSDHELTRDVLTIAPQANGIILVRHSPIYFILLLMFPVGYYRPFCNLHLNTESITRACMG